MNTPNIQLRSHLKPGIISKIRCYFQKVRLGSCGNNVYFENNVGILRYPGNITIHDDVILKEGSRICSCNENAHIEIGKRTTIGYHTFIFASDGITIGSDCLIAPFVYIVDSDHGIERSRPINVQPNSTGPVRIGNDVWIGTGSKILKGVSIADGAVIAAGSVVNQDVESSQIVGGTPARTIGMRR